MPHFSSASNSLAAEIAFAPHTSHGPTNEKQRRYECILHGTPSSVQNALIPPIMSRTHTLGRSRRRRYECFLHGTRLSLQNALITPRTVNGIYLATRVRIFADSAAVQVLVPPTGCDASVAPCVVPPPPSRYCSRLAHPQQPVLRRTPVMSPNVPRDMWCGGRT